MHYLFSQFYHNLTVKSAEKICWQNFYGSSVSLAIAELALKQKNLLLVITKDLQTAAKLTAEVTFFLKQKDNEQNAKGILKFPNLETLPYDHFSPHQDIISDRLFALYQLSHLKTGILITSISTLMQRLPPQQYIEQNSFVLQCDDNLDIMHLRQTLEKQSYNCTNKVIEHGEFAVRGSILDVFPMGSNVPYRIDLFDQKVDSIRIFDTETQLTTAKTDAIKLLPAKEFPLTDEGIARFRQNWRTHFTGDPTHCPLYQSVSNKESPNGIEYYLPLFFANTTSLCDYLPETSLIFAVDDIYQSAIAFWQEVKNRHNEMQYDITRPILPPSNVFWTVEETFSKLKQLPQINAFTNAQEQKEQKLPSPSTQFNIAPLSPLNIDNKAPKPLAKLQTFSESYKGNILFCAESKGRVETLLELLNPINIHPQYCDAWQDFLNSKSRYNITVSPIEQGFCVSSTTINATLALISEIDLFGQQLVLQRRYRKQHKQINTENIVSDLTELHIGAPVVHIEHGIGRYLGLKTIATDNINAEFLTLEYANGAKLYVPISSLHLISRYTGTDPDNIPYSNLGSDKWEKTKKKALTKIRDVAAELLALYAERAAKTGSAFTLPIVDYQKFAGVFPFEETEDQKQAINAVIKDLTAPQYMDRLICGDVGFGKTEVAMRAAFIAAHNGKQVAILVPTTILAQQHYLNFQDRFADWPFKIELISRFRSTKEQNLILKQLKAGIIDIIIGTHKLLQPDIQFKDLGLLIIDEEHRFGVKQKERIKKLRPEVDILTLTATPIPRTLNMAFAGVRNFSIIATPPARRLAIKTFIHERNQTIIREAIWREVLRGGQVYFLHNNVDTIEKVAQELSTLIPTIRLAIAHGQMREQQLERIMSDFYHGRSNVLVCTTIIESGIDVPTANTIIIDRADRFGLAQLHQLRGRVGRSHHQAYAYLLVTNKKLLSPDAKRRLDAITSMEDLGAGFNLATHDLEIRGAGELLGSEQSGHIEDIGFSLYMEYLEAAVKALKEGHEPTWNELEKPQSIIDIKIPALFPENYINDISTRLTLYKRLANAKNHDEINLLKEEIVDRFGALPLPSKNLFRITEIKLNTEKLGICKIIASKNSGIIEFSEKPNPNIDATKVIKLLQQKPKNYKLRGSNKLAFYCDYDEKKFELMPTILLDFVERLLEELVK